MSSTLYTPVFPPALRIPDSPASCSTSCDSNEDRPVCRKKPYIHRLKERYILLASIPRDQLCPPSRETSPASESRIEALRLRMRKSRELGFPHDPQLTLACSGVRGGDWAVQSVRDDGYGERQYILPDAEEEWFRWERKQKATREQRMMERKAAENRKMIAKWSEAIEDATPNHLPESVQRNSTKNQPTSGRHLSHQSPPSRSSHRDDSEPVERVSSPMPPAPVLEPIPDFSDSFSVPNSPPSLPRLPPDTTFPEDVPPSPSFAAKDVQTSTPQRQGPLSNPVFQLSSPVSPPRDVHPVTASRTLSSILTKRSREGIADTRTEIKEEPSTPPAAKKPRTLIEPITPASVPRPSVSQEQINSSNLKKLPTLTALLASSRKTSRGRSRATETPRRNTRGIAELSSSQPVYSMFRPPFQSSQPRAMSLPPSPSGPPTSTQPVGSQKSNWSSGLYYQSQFNVEGKVDEVAAFLNADVWDVES